MLELYIEQKSGLFVDENSAIVDQKFRLDLILITNLDFD